MKRLFRYTPDQVKEIVGRHTLNREDVPPGNYTVELVLMLDPVSKDVLRFECSLTHKNDREDKNVH